MFEAVVAYVMTLAVQYPIIASVLMIIGSLRLLLKPAFAFAHLLADQTATTADNAAIDAVEASAFMKGVYFVLDWLASVKLIKA